MEALSSSGYDVISLDWTIAPGVARAAVKGIGFHSVGTCTVLTNYYIFPGCMLFYVSDRVSLQGNLEPCILFCSEATLRAHARTMLDQFGTQNYIANLGHGMMPDHSPDAVAALVDEVHSYSEQLIAKGK
jgi:uroporphyrinogen decarboxylase